MHEVGITQNIVDIIEENVRAQKGSAKVISVTVAIGELSGVIPESIEFCFDVCSQGTLLEGANLKIEHIKGRGRCNHCGANDGFTDVGFTCPDCGRSVAEIYQGKELKIIEVEVE